MIAKETFESLRAAIVGTPVTAVEQRSTPPGVERSRAAFLQALPELLKNQKHDRWFALYHGDACIRIARKYEELLLECCQRGIDRDKCYLDRKRTCVKTEG